MNYDSDMPPVQEMADWLTEPKSTSSTPRPRLPGRGDHAGAAGRARPKAGKALPLAARRRRAGALKARLSENRRSLPSSRNKKEFGLP